MSPKWDLSHIARDLFSGPLDIPGEVARWVYDDGGRAAAGYRGNADDCTVRSIAIATGLPYAEVYGALYARTRTLHLKKERNRSPRLGVLPKVFRPYLESLGWEFVPTMGIGTGCKVHLRPEELPSGRIICSVSRHLVAVVDGIARDTWDCTREGTRCVYGYFRKRAPEYVPDYQI